MTYSVAVPEEQNIVLKKLLLRDDGQEDLCFALWRPSSGEGRYSALLTEVVTPILGERSVHGNAAFHPEYLERVLGLALEKGMGIAFLHSHTGPGWQDMSGPDKEAELRIAPAIKAATGFPVLGMTLGTDGSWSGRFWLRENGNYRRYWCDRIRIIGDAYNVTFANHLIPPPTFREEFKRTRSAWGDAVQSDLMRTRVGIVGVGSVGSVVAEALARMGVQDIVLIDFDTIKKHNLDRHIHATLCDVDHFKTHVVARRLGEIATCENFKVTTCEYGVNEDFGFKTALDCDVLFSCVDRPWPRQVLNTIALWHLIPVIDGGIAIQKSKMGKLQSADWKAHITTPGRICMECLGQFSGADVSAEKSGLLDDPEYIASLATNHHLLRNENVIVFSINLASMQLLQFLTMFINPLGVNASVGGFSFHFTSGVLDSDVRSCGPQCLTKTYIGYGDKASEEYVLTVEKDSQAQSVRDGVQCSKDKNRKTTVWRVLDCIWDLFRNGKSFKAGK